MSMQTDRSYRPENWGLAPPRPVAAPAVELSPADLRPAAAPATRSPMTRLLHLLLLLTVLNQLIGSNYMERPLPGDEPDWPFALHQWIGVAGLGFVALFWLWTLARGPSETRLSRLMPWFSASGRAEVFRDVRALLSEALTLKAPSDAHEALASAAHGLGLLVVSFMALTGASWFFFFSGTPVGKLVMAAHKLSANLMWAYLIIHAGAAVFHHLLGSDIFSRMFVSRRSAAGASIEAP